MGRAWLTGVTIAGIVGSGGAAVAGVVVIEDSVAPPTSASAIESAEAVLPTLPPAAPQTSVLPGSPLLTTYDVGGAGSVTIAARPDSMAAGQVVPGVGWTLLGTAGSEQHLEVQFADASIVVTFVADLVDGQVVVATTATPVVPAAEPVAAPAATPRPQGASSAPATSRPAGTSASTPATTGPAPAAGPASTAGPTSTAAPATSPTAPATTAPATTTPVATAPPASATTAPSGSGADEGDDGDDGHDDGGEEPADD